eukprot:6012345-Prorocentrum_lima.AAC.1
MGYPRSFVAEERAYMDVALGVKANGHVHVDLLFGDARVDEHVGVEPSAEGLKQGFGEPLPCWR